MGQACKKSPSIPWTFVAARFLLVADYKRAGPDSPVLEFLAVRIPHFVGLMTLAATVMAYGLAPLDIKPLAALIAAIMTFLTVPWLLKQHLNRISELRYLRGNVQQALLEWRFWRPLVTKEQYILLRAGMLVQAELFDSVATLLQDPAVGVAPRENALFCLHRSREEWDLALAALDRAIPVAEGQMKAAFLVERACFLAEHYPARLPQALNDYREATKYPCAGELMGSILLGLEGVLLTVTGQTEAGLEVLQKHLVVLEQHCQGSADILSSLANHRRQLGWALWASGRRTEATEMLLKSRDTYTSKRWQRLLDKDVANVRDGGDLFPDPPLAAQQAAQEYLRDYSSPERWPGNPEPVAPSAG